MIGLQSVFGCGPARDLRHWTRLARGGQRPGFARLLRGAWRSAAALTAPGGRPSRIRGRGLPTAMLGRVKGACSAPSASAAQIGSLGLRPVADQAEAAARADRRTTSGWLHLRGTDPAQRQSVDAPGTGAFAGTTRTRYPPTGLLPRFRAPPPWPSPPAETATNATPPIKDLRPRDSSAHRRERTPDRGR